MNTTRLLHDLRDFLISAKRKTYAGSDDDTTIENPLLEQSLQLEYREGDWFYRDIYYGMSHFSGMETVYLSGRPVWSMTYSGGTKPDLDVGKTRGVYTFLRSALRDLPEVFPVRGPAVFRSSDYHYRLDAEGDLSRFSGQEYIRCQGVEVYTLTFAGGGIR